MSANPQQGLLDHRSLRYVKGALSGWRALPRVVESIAAHPLNRGRTVKALSRFLGWQISSRISSGPIVLPWVNDVRIVARQGDTGITGNIYCGLHEYADMAFVLHATTPQDFFVDIGANVGSYVLLACGAAGARGLALEPVPSTYARLMDNLLVNNLLGRVRAINSGASEAEQTLYFSADEDTTNHVVTGPRNENPTNTIAVPTVAIDAILDGTEATILKIDVEGYEHEVIRGAQKSLSKANAVIIEINGSGARYGHSDAELIAELLRLGLSPHRYLPDEYRLIPVDVHDEVHSGNMLFIRDARSFEAALARQLRYRVNLGDWIAV